MALTTKPSMDVTVAPSMYDLTNCTENCSDLYSYSQAMKLDDVWEVVLLIVAYLVVFVVGVIGNLFVLAVVIRSPHMWNVTNLFISNLAMADLFVLVFCLPFNLINSLYESKYRFCVEYCCQWGSVYIDVYIDEGVELEEKTMIFI